MRESDRKLKEAIKAYRENYERMTPEERAIEDEKRRALESHPSFQLLDDSLED